MSLLDLISSRLVSPHRNPDGTIQAQCPACAHEGGDSLKVHLRVWPNGAFRCVKDDTKEHNRLIRSLIRGDEEAGETALLDETEYTDPDPRVETVKVYDESVLTKLIPDYGYWTGRGISEDVLRRIGGGVAPVEERSKLSGRYVLPCRDDRERIVGWAGRLLTHSSFAPKWKILGRKGLFLFPPVSVVEPSARAREELILTEGQGDCLALMTAGIDHVYSLFGVSLSSKVVGRIVGLNPKRILIATNNEGSGVGNRAAEEIRRRLMAFVPEERVVVALPPVKDFAMMTVEQIRQWYAGVGRTGEGDATSAAALVPEVARGEDAL